MKQTPLFVGLGHYSRTGKSTFANTIQNYCTEFYPSLYPSLTCKIIPFAWKLKQMCYDLYGWTGYREPEFYETAAGAKARHEIIPALGMTPIQLWTRFGTYGVRNKVLQTSWVDYVMKTDHKADIVIVPDVRMKNEFDGVREKGGVLYKILRPGVEPLDTPADQALAKETGWDEVFSHRDLLSLTRCAAGVAETLCNKVLYND